jgi:hypothetical protein
MSTLLSTLVEWYCPNCGKREQTVGIEARPHARFHTCPKLRMLSTPMVVAGTAAKVEVREPEDYIRSELVQRDPEQGRPVMAVVTTRDDGQDTAVFAPAATGQGA